MAFTVGNRVVVTDQSNRYRDKLGTVVSRDAGETLSEGVRLDGFSPEDKVWFQESQLRISTQPCPLTY